MRKVITLVACLSAAMVLSGCEVKAMLDDLNKETAELKYDRATSRSKLLELGEKQGFLIAYDYVSSEGDKGTAKVGNKDGFFWVFNDVKEGENVESFGKAAEAKTDSYVAYDYNEESNKFEATETIEKEAFDAVIETGVSWLCSFSRFRFSGRWQRYSLGKRMYKVQIQIYLIRSYRWKEC